MTASDFDEVIDRYHSALGEFVKGDPEPLKSIYSHREDVSLANPFGPPVSGWQQVAETMDRAASNYRDGEVSGFESIAKHVTPALASLVELERYRARVGGGDELVSVALRVTSVFRLEDGIWKAVHRHADPITAARPVDSVVLK